MNESDDSAATPSSKGPAEDDVTAKEAGSANDAVEGASAPPEPPGPEELEEQNAALQQEVERLRGTADKSRRVRRRRIRGILAGFLVLLTSISIIATTVAVWVNRTVWNTDRYVALVAPLASDPQVTDALATKLTDQIFQGLSVQQRLSSAITSIKVLPDQVALLAGPITSAAQSFILGQVKQFMRSDAFKNLWVQLNRTAQQKIVALLQGDLSQLPNVSIHGGEVRLNMIGVIAAVLRQMAQRGLNLLGVNVTIPEIPANLDPSAAIRKLDAALPVSIPPPPPDFGQLTIMTADQLTAIQTTAHRLKQLAVVLFLLSVVLIALTILVAPNRRRIVIWLGLGAALAFLVAVIAVRRIESSILDNIKTPGSQRAARDAFSLVSHSARSLGLWIFFIALAAAVVAYLLGRPRWLMAAIAWVRRVLAGRPGGSELEVWVGAHGDVLRIGGIAVAALILFFTGIGWLSVLIIGGLLGLFLWGVSAARHRTAPTTPEAIEAPDDQSLPSAAP